MKFNKNYLIIGGVSVLIILTFISYIFIDKSEEDVYLAEEIVTTNEILKSFYVDVKGAVNSPGVYEFKNGDRVFNAIETAGGLTKNGNTSNINLSRKLNSEMVVYVYTNTEIKNGTNNITCDTKCNCESLEVNNCYPEVKEDKININTASTDQLLKLTGIGESKAQAIIKYREDNGNFITIEDLKNVSGIGDVAFEKIKDMITV